MGIIRGAAHRRPGWVIILTIYHRRLAIGANLGLRAGFRRSPVFTLVFLSLLRRTPSTWAFISGAFKMTWRRFAPACLHKPHPADPRWPCALWTGCRSRLNIQDADGTPRLAPLPKCRFSHLVLGLALLLVTVHMANYLGSPGNGAISCRLKLTAALSAARPSGYPPCRRLAKPDLLPDQATRSAIYSSGAGIPATTELSTWLPTIPAPLDGIASAERSLWSSFKSADVIDVCTLHSCDLQISSA